MKKQFFKNRLGLYMAASALVLGQACTDLEPEFTDSVSIEAADGAFGGVADADNSLESLYNSVEGLAGQTDQYALAEVSAENIAVLTRGVDWSDNGIWRTLHNHTWDPSHNFVLNTWNNANSQILAATQLLDPVSAASPAIVAQAQVIRALQTYIIVSNFGQVPFRGVNEGVDVDPTVLSAQEAFDFLIGDLNAAIASGDLSTHGPDGDTFLIGEAYARFLRARVNLNSGVILGTPAAGAMDQVIADVNAIEALGFALDTSANYFDIWDLGSGNTEVILHLNTFTGTRVFNQLHPNQTGWNGFVTMTETFRLFGSDDVNDDARLGLAGPDFNGVSTGYLRGQQLNGDGVALTDRQNNALIYENELLQSLEVNNERTGIRIVKYPQRGGDGFPALNNDFVWARFANALLMRAEATLRGGSGSPVSALADVNALRTRAGAAVLGSVDLASLAEARRREMNAEGYSREDQLRFGTFSDTWELKTVQDDFRVLFPIPGTALATNPNLVQNPGY